MTSCNQEYVVVGGYAYPKNCVPTKVTQSSKIQYNGVDLPNTGINTCDTLNVALQKIDSAIGSACDIIEVTYEELVLLINSSSLSPGSFYKITDFATTHYLTSEGVILDNSPIVGVTEPLIVFATSEATIDKEAKSSLYPQDIIYYDWSPANWLEDVSFGGTTAEIISGFKGVIYFRHDTLLDNYMGYDFRNVKFRRYKTEYPSWDSGTIYALDAKVQDATGAYCSMESGNLNNPLSTVGKWFKFIDFTITPYLSHTSTSELTEYIDCLTFQESTGSCTYDKSVRSMHFDTFKDNYTYYDTFGYGILMNNVFFLPQETNYYSYYNNTFGSEFSVNTFACQYCSQNNFGKLSYFNIITSENCYRNRTESYFENNKVSTTSFISNTIDDTFYNNILGGSSISSNSINSNFNNNHICYQFNTNTIGLSFGSCWIKSAFTNNCINSGFLLNVIYDTFSLNTIGNNSTTNVIIGVFSNNIIGNSFSSNNISDNFSNNNIGNTCQGNDFTKEFQYNTIGNHFNNNHIQSVFTYNTIQNDFNQFLVNCTGIVTKNTLRDSCKGVVGVNYIDFSSATYLIGDYNCDIFTDINGNLKLSYIDGVGVLTVVNANS